MTPETGKSYFTVMSRGWRLRCPRCGQAPLFKKWFRMHIECGHCHLRFEREPGYFLGSIYINYGLTSLLVIVFYFTLFFSGWTSPRLALWLVAGFALLFPIGFFRYARSLWLGFDHYWDPTQSESAEPDSRG